MKDISKMTWIIIISSFALLTIFIGSTTKFVQKLTYKEVIAVEINSEQIEEGIELEKESKSTDHFTTYKSYPTTSIKTIDEQIYKWTKQKEEAFLKEIDDYLTDDTNNLAANFNLDSDVHKLSDNLFSIKIETEFNFDESEKYNDVKTFLIDTKNEKVIENEDVFNKENFSTKDRFQLMVNTLEDSLDFDEWQSELENLNELDLHIDDEDITFYIKGENVKDDNDILKAKVPIIQLADQFSEEYYEIFISEDMNQEIEQARIQEEQTKQEEVEGHKYIALTFDDGPEPDTTSRILNTLDQYDAKATFFLLGKNVQAYPEIAKNIADQEHEIANHSITHIDLNTINENRIRNEMTESKQQIENITGIKPTLFRPPYGSTNETVTKIASETEQAIAMWSLDTNDWQHRNPNITLEKIKNNVRSGSIILMHDIHKETADALPSIMKYLDQQGYEFVTMSELLPYIEGEGIGPYYGK